MNLDEFLLIAVLLKLGTDFFISNGVPDDVDAFCLQTTFLVRRFNKLKFNISINLFLLKSIANNLVDFF